MTEILIVLQESKKELLVYTVARRCGLSIEETTSILLMLVQKGEVRAIARKRRIYFTNVK